MKSISNNKEVNDFLKGRAYLVSDEYNWINVEDQEIGMVSMEAQYQINCAKWLVKCLENLRKVDEDAQEELVYLIKGKMDEFKEIFPTVIKREIDNEQSNLKNDFDKIVEEFNHLYDEL